MLKNANIIYAKFLKNAAQLVFQKIKDIVCLYMKIIFVIVLSKYII